MGVKLTSPPLPGPKKWGLSPSPVILISVHLGQLDLNRSKTPIPPHRLKAHRHLQPKVS